MRLQPEQRRGVVLASILSGYLLVLIGVSILMVALARIVTLGTHPRKQRIFGARRPRPAACWHPEPRSRGSRSAERDPRCRLTTAIKENTMQITRNSLDTNPGPSDWFTGTVYIDAIAAPVATARTAAALVHFTPGARTAWHTHPYGQTIYVTEGLGRCQHEGGPVEEIRPGDRVYFEPGENHWHGAAPNRFMTHIAIQEADESGSPVTWGEHVTDEQYSAPPAS